MFDIAWSELFVILVVALVVVGPKDLPRLMRTAGQWAGRARAMADQFRRSFDEMARQSELEDLRAEVNKLRAETTEATTKSLADLNQGAFAGIPAKPFIEDVGAAPPARPVDLPAAVAAEIKSAMIPQSAPAAVEAAQTPQPAASPAVG